jgi:hypothetical protein
MKTTYHYEFCDATFNRADKCKDHESNHVAEKELQIANSSAVVLLMKNNMKNEAEMLIEALIQKEGLSCHTTVKDVLSGTH